MGLIMFILLIVALHLLVSVRIPLVQRVFGVLLSLVGIIFRFHNGSPVRLDK